MPRPRFLRYVNEHPGIFETHDAFMQTMNHLPQIVRDRLLMTEDSNDGDRDDGEKNAAAFAAGLARGVRKLRNNSGNERLLRAAGLCVSKALQSSSGESFVTGSSHQTHIRTRCKKYIFCELIARYALGPNRELLPIFPHHPLIRTQQ